MILKESLMQYPPLKIHMQSGNIKSVNQASQEVLKVFILKLKILST